MLILIAMLIALSGFEAAADVRFITETENTANSEKFKELNERYVQPTINQQSDNEKFCRAQGYTYKKCENGMLLADPCPYDHNLYANCCPEAYRYLAAECRAMGKSPSEYSCGGFYKCQ